MVTGIAANFLLQSAASATVVASMVRVWFGRLADRQTKDGHLAVWC